MSAQLISSQQDRRACARMGSARLRAFTLVELLVVISIIGLLVALLMPALSTARASAQQIQCAAQLKQIGTASELYRSDNKGWYVPFQTPGRGAYMHMLASYMGGPSDGSDVNTVLRKSNAIEVKVAGRIMAEIWRCPTYTGQDFTEWRNTYAYNGNTGTTGSGGLGWGDYNTVPYKWQFINTDPTLTYYVGRAESEVKGLTIFLSEHTWSWGNAVQFIPLPSSPLKTRDFQANADAGLSKFDGSYHLNGSSNFFLTDGSVQNMNWRQTMDNPTAAQLAAIDTYSGKLYRLWDIRR